MTRLLTAIPRFERGLLLFGLVLTGLALLPWSPQGPFDARTYQPLSGVDLAFTWQGALLEPLGAIGHALAGAPTPLAAALATAGWVLVAGVAWGWLRRSGGRGRTLLGMTRSALTLLLAFLGYVALFLLVPFPSWQLTTAKPETIVTDLQSHTFASHDGLVAPEKSLRTLRDRGIEVAAISEHRDPSGAFEARRISRSHPDYPAILPGVELRAMEGYVLGIGVDRGKALPGKLRSRAKLGEFVQTIQEEHGGAVVALSWRLGEAGVSEMAAAGVDGLEIANLGHPALPEAARKAVLKAGQERQTRLAASSDWHGWTGTWRTWTLIRPDEPTKDRPAATVLEVLRDPEAGEMVPVVAGYLGPPSPVRVALSPAAESVRYAAELSPKRLLGWWLWLGGAAAIAALLRRRGLSPAPVLTRSALGVIAGALVWVAAPMLVSPPAAVADPAFHKRIGGYGVVLGALVLVAALLVRPSPLARPLQSGSIAPGWASLRALLRRMGGDFAAWGRVVASREHFVRGFPTRLPRFGRKGWALTGLLALTVAALMILVDRAAILWLHDHYDAPGWVATLSDFGVSHWYLVGALAVYLLGPDGLWRARAALLFWGVAASGILVNVFKAILGRPRPEVLLEQGTFGFQFFQVQADHLSFPSGHTTTIFSVAMCFALFWPRLRYLFFAMACAVAATRVLLLHHYPSDVLAGAWLGAVTVLWLHRNQSVPVYQTTRPSWA